MIDGNLTLHNVVEVSLSQDARLDAPLELQIRTSDHRCIEVTLYAQKEQRIQLLLGHE